MSEKKHWRLVVNYADAKPNEEDWIEDSWLACSPEEIIENFNSPLRPGERKRELMAAIPLKDNSRKPHSWMKTNLVTKMGKGGSYDTCKCENCEVTGKRFGLGGSVTLDPKYKSKKYKFCNV